MNREQKAQAIEEIATQLNESSAVLAVDYRGISVPQAAELRTQLREADTSFKVVKNRLTLRAADEAGAGELKDHLTGPTALAFVRGDVALAAKTIAKLGGEWELLAYKGGLMEGAVLADEDFQAIAKLPGRDQLNAQFAGVVASPLTGLVRGLGSMIQGLALQLGQIAEQGLVSGEAPAEAPPAEEEAPAEEPPAEEEQPAAETDPDPGDSPEESSDEQAPTESDSDPEPGESSEESSDEQAPEEGGQVDTVEAAGEGDADLGEEEPGEGEGDDASGGDDPADEGGGDAGDGDSGDDAGDGDSEDDKEDADGDDD